MQNNNKTPNEKTEKKISPVRIIVCLTVICVAVAALLGAVDHATRATIADNERNEKQNAIKSIFGDGVATELISEEGAKEEVYVILRDGRVYGYCAEVAPKGFGGDIVMMVGVDHTGSVCGVNIVSMSETPGLGSRTNTPAFLDQFKGKSGELAVGTNVDAVSGATISSRAVTGGVNEALSRGVDLAALAAERNTTVWNGEAPQTETEPVTETEPTTESAEPAVTEADTRVEDAITYADAHFSAQPGAADAPTQIAIELHTDTDAYITETEEPPKDGAGNYIFPPEETETEVNA